MNTHPMDKTNNLVTASNSILKRFNVPTFHPSLPALDDALKQHVRIVFLLFDALGSAIIARHAPKKSKLKTSPIIKMTSVVPATTVAATTAFLRGKYPAETGWLGWTQYFADLDKRINVFINVDADLDEAIPGPNIMSTRYPDSTVFDLVAATNPNVRVSQVWPGFVKGGAKTEKEFFEQVHEHLEVPGPCLMYGYWGEPDSTMHEKGVKAYKTRWVVRSISKQLDKLTAKHKDTLFVILADHGMMNVDYFDIKEHADFYETLKRPFTLEGRNAMFYVKDGQHKEFEELFAKYYGKHFRLIKRNEFASAEVFGFCPVSENASVFFGDYLAQATGIYGFYYEPSPALPGVKLKGHHAGITPNEMSLQLTLINN